MTILFQEYPFDRRDWAERTVLSSARWWNTFYPALELSKLAQKVCSLPASVAACDRSFSRQSRIHNDVRNRLQEEKVDKMVFLKTALQLQRFVAKMQYKSGFYFVYSSYYIALQ